MKSSRYQEDYWESESTTANNRQHYIQLRLRLLCSMTQAAVSTVHTEGSLEVYLVLLPESSQNNASQKIKKKKRSEWKKEEVGTWIKEHCTPTRLEEATRKKEMYKRRFFCFKMPCICYRKVYYLRCIIQYQQTQIILPPEAEVFHNQKSFADSNPET